MMLYKFVSQTGSLWVLYMQGQVTDFERRFTPCPEMGGHGASFCPYIIKLFRVTYGGSMYGPSMAIETHHFSGPKQGRETRFSHEEQLFY